MSKAEKLKSLIARKEDLLDQKRKTESLWNWELLRGKLKNIEEEIKEMNDD